MGFTVGTAVALAVVGALLWTGAGCAARLGAGVVPETSGVNRSTSGVGGWVEDRRRRVVVCVTACAAVGNVAGGPVLTAIGGVVGALLSWWVGRLEPPSAVRERRAVERDLPLVVDLLAACAEVGLPVQAALVPVAGAVGGPLARRLETVSSRLALGAAPVEEWERISADPQLVGLGRAMTRAHRSGAPVAEALARFAADQRRERRLRLQVAARAVGVKVAAPLAACFLPAFMLIGVVPTVVGGFTHLGL